MDMATISERYISGANATDLTVRSERDGAVEALVSVAWSRSKVGAALLRLHSEWDGAMRSGLRFEQSFLRMKSLPEVRGAMFVWALGNAPLPPTLDRIEEANDLSWSILTWVLDPTCKTCSGTGWVTLANAPKKPCTTCHGTQEAVIPHGERGRAMVAYLESCMYRAKASIKGRAGR